MFPRKASVDFKERPNINSSRSFLFLPFVMMPWNIFNRTNEQVFLSGGTGTPSRQPVFWFVYPQHSHHDLDTDVKLLGICLDEIKKPDLSHYINQAHDSSVSDMGN